MAEINCDKQPAIEQYIKTHYIEKDLQCVNRLHKISVKYLWNNKYRVNIWENIENNRIVQTRKITKSYFVTYDNDTNVVKSCI